MVPPRNTQFIAATNLVRRHPATNCLRQGEAVQLAHPAACWNYELDPQNSCWSYELDLRPHARPMMRTAMVYHRMDSMQLLCRRSPLTAAVIDLVAVAVVAVLLLYSHSMFSFVFSDCWAPKAQLPDLGA